MTGMIFSALMETVPFPYMLINLLMIGADSILIG